MSSKHRSLESFLPIHEADSRRVQADIALSLYAKADKIRRSKHLNWKEVITSCVQKFVDELEDEQKIA